MKKEHTEKLLADFPDLYAQYNLPMNQTCMCWGFECGDGWFDLIYRLSEKLAEIGDVQACQVKEKYGTLRFYVDAVNREQGNQIDELIDQAEEESANTCDICGLPGELNGGGWLTTRCATH
jgi:hypothetical protein